MVIKDKDIKDRNKRAQQATVDRKRAIIWNQWRDYMLSFPDNQQHREAFARQMQITQEELASICKQYHSKMAWNNGA